MNGYQGYRYLTRFGFATAPNSSHFFIGLVNTTGAFNSVHPPSSLINGVVIGWANGALGSNLSIWRNDGSGNAVQLDLGGYAKGYALDRAAAILRAKGVGNALINIGGNVMALGAKGSQPWRVGIQHPRATAPLATLELHDGEAIGTSGDYQRFFELEGRRYCHLLDPRNGHPAEGVQAVTVLITPREGAGALSDAASKPLFIAGAGQWRGLAQRLGVAHALRIDGRGVMHVTAAFRERLTMLASDVKLVVEP